MSQINVVDLELPQLAEVKKQLDEVIPSLSRPNPSTLCCADNIIKGIGSSHWLFCPTEQSISEVSFLH